MKKTESVAGRIKSSLEKVPGIRFAFIYGSFAEKPENPASDVDIKSFQRP